MESLTRNNYEIWFLDYLDGQLSNEQLETLLDFLELNPDLKQELLGVSGISLTAGSESIDQKEFLHKGPADIPGVAALDQLCIARMENDLPDEEARLFDIRLNEDDRLKENYSAFLLTRLNAADQILFPYKKDLLKKTRVLAPWIITAISSAAVVLLAWFLWPDSKETLSPPVAQTETVNPDIQKPVPGTQSTASDMPQVASNEQNRIFGVRNRKPDDRNPKPGSRFEPQPGKTESMPREFVPMNRISRQSSGTGPRIPDPQSTKLLFASNYPAYLPEPSYAEDALTIPQFALQLFRERILGEDRAVVRRTRFSLWEVAGAGVNKINDFAGTRMELNREYDTNGDIQAVSFNSRFFEVETPIKGQADR